MYISLLVHLDQIIMLGWYVNLLVNPDSKACMLAV